MTLVERLRESYDPADDENLAALVLEAADRIEELEKEVAHWTECYEGILKTIHETWYG